MGRAGGPGRRRARPPRLTCTLLATQGDRDAVHRGARRARRRRPHHGGADLARRPRRPGRAGAAPAQRRARAWRPARPRPSPRCWPGTPTRSSGPATPRRSWQRKNFKATGGTIAADRPLALDLLGVASQLVFNTFNNGHLLRLERSGDLDLAYGAARAHNRGMVEFCSVDPRLLPTCYVPLADFDRVGGDGRRGDRDGRGRAARPERLPQRALPQPHRPRPRVARRPRRPASRSCSTSAAAGSCSTRSTS